MTPAPALGAVLPTLRAARPSLHPGEQRVSDVLLERPEWALSASTRDVAGAAGVSTATVVRTAQRLGYRGFPHLRVLLARDLALASPRTPVDAHSAAALVHGYFGAVASSVVEMASLLAPAAVEQAVDLLAGAQRIVVAGSGVSAPVAQEFAMRLAAIGRVAEAPADNLDQQIRARLLTPQDVCVIVSGTGATTATLNVAHAAVASGAPVIALTAFTRSPLSELADVELVAVAGAGTGLREELLATVRLPQTILVNALVLAVSTRDVTRSDAARAKVMDVVAQEFDDD